MRTASKGVTNTSSQGSVMQQCCCLPMRGQKRQLKPALEPTMRVQLIALGLKTTQIVALVLDQQLQLLNLALVVRAQALSHSATHGALLPVLKLARFRAHYQPTVRCTQFVREGQTCVTPSCRVIT